MMVKTAGSALSADTDATASRWSQYTPTLPSTAVMSIPFAPPTRADQVAAPKSQRSCFFILIEQ